MGDILSLTGPSGSGKSTLATMLIEREPHRFLFLESLTTRTKRPSDLPGEYQYVTEAQFATFVSQGEMLWHVAHAGARYGTRRSAVRDALLIKEPCVSIMILVPQVLQTLQAYINDAVPRMHQGNWIACYLHSPGDATLWSRMQRRGDSIESIKMRIEKEQDWSMKALASGVRMHYIEGNSTPEEMATKAKTFLPVRTF
jgi:guanylate kinase